MNKEQFIYWLKGFTKAVNEEGPTPKQWETIVSELSEIKDCPDYGSPIGERVWGVPNTAPNWQRPHYVNPYNSGKTDTKVTYGSGTTSGISGVITTGNTSTTLVKGANVSYTTNQLELDLK
jgi:hypothetical protein